LSKKRWRRNWDLENEIQLLFVFELPLFSSKL
jgi:hypothetical protein